MIIISQATVNKYLDSKAEVDLSFYEVDDGDAFVEESLVFVANKSNRIVVGVVTDLKNNPKEDFNKRILISVHATDKGVDIVGWKFLENIWTESSITIVDWKEALFSRLKGLFETDTLKEKKVVVLGVGSGGSPIAIELAKAGVGNLYLIDHDRLEIENIVRHVCGISDLGRFKTKALKDLLLDKNPSINIKTYEIKCDMSTKEQVRLIIRNSDLVICGTDNRESRIILNQICLDEDKVCIYGGTFERAYGGQVLRVIPKKTMCYQCFVDIMPEMESNQEISNPEQANQIAYSDRLVPVEPGLSNDIAPISSMCTKLAILELLRGQTTFESQYDDLRSSWYMWLNRREGGTDYENLPALDDAKGDMRILAWYGVENEKNPTCPACGDFYSKFPGASQKLTQSDISSFAPENIEDN